MDFQSSKPTTDTGAVAFCLEAEWEKVEIKSGLGNVEFSYAVTTLKISTGYINNWCYWRGCCSYLTLKIEYLQKVPVGCDPFNAEWCTLIYFVHGGEQPTL